MATVTSISSLSDPRVADYASLKDAQLRQLAADPADPPTGLFIAEGELVVRQLITSALRIRSIFLAQQRLEGMEAALTALPPGVPVYVADQLLMNEVVGFNIHRGILAAGYRPTPPPLGSILAASSSLLVLEDLANHDNMGGLFRAAAALAGAANPATDGPAHGASVLLSPRCCDPLYRKAIRVSMGAALRVPFVRLTPWPVAIQSLRDAGFTLVALTPSPDAASIDQVPRPGRPALLLGAEGPGLTRGVMEAADLRVRIPIDPASDSLNVVTAGAIALHRLGPAGIPAGA